MKVLIKQFLGANHSWSVVGWGIANSLKKQHDVHLFSTDGIKNTPESLKENIIGYVEYTGSNKVIGRAPDKDYDCQISYTAMMNFPAYLSNGIKNRFGIWCFEWSGPNVLPNGFAKNYRMCDAILAPSNFAKQVFLESGIPDNAVKVIPHGIDVQAYKQKSTMSLPTKKRYKILANIAQNHLRKNIPGLLDAYGKAFTASDDVCLILKAKDKPITQQFEVSLNECLKIFYNKYPKHAEIKVLSNFITDMSELYRSVDTVFSMAHCEGFYFPGLEAMASGKLSIAPGWGGQLDFLNNDNALLVNGKETRANMRSMYWENNINAIWFQPDIDDAVSKLKYAYNNYETLNQKIEKQRDAVYSKYDWDVITSDIVNLCKGIK